MKPTARRSFEIKSPDVSCLCLIIFFCGWVTFSFWMKQRFSFESVLVLHGKIWNCLIFMLILAHFLLFFELRLVFPFHWCLLGDFSCLKSQLFWRIWFRALSGFPPAVSVSSTRFLIRPYKWQSPLQVCFSFIRSWNLTELRVWRRFSLLVESVSFICMINGREAIAEAIIGFLLVFCCCRDFCSDHMTSQSLQICFLFIHSCSFNWIACVTSFFALSGASFFVHWSD